MSMRIPRKAAGFAAPARPAPHLVPLDSPRQPGAPPLLQARELWIGAHFPQLTVESRDPRREQALLERLATLAQRFTPRVSLVPPDGLTLEVKGSLHLFGGVAKLGAGFLAGCRSAGTRPRLALAPTALAALVGARSGKPFNVREPAWLIGALAPLPLVVLRWPPEVLERLAKVGVRTIGAALRLPRAGLARRFGAEPLASLDRLVGRAADLRGSLRAPERFRMRRACTYELERHEAVLAALAPLLESLGKFLETRQCGITQLECRLWHRHAPPTQCVLKLAAPGADPRRLSALLGERLATLTLPEPVRSCELRSGTLVPRELYAHGLWQPGEHGGGARAESTDLIECLRARLGVEAVHGLQVHPTHRPEAASRRVEIGAVEVQAKPPSPGPARGSPRPAPAPALVPWPAFHRPLWLLPAPEPLSEMEGLPQRQGPLHLIGDPERIETGWWEGEAARDYYHAVDLHGVRLWVFRERKKPHRWFLQGVFG
jgi:protein ImuB